MKLLEPLFILESALLAVITVYVLLATYISPKVVGGGVSLLVYKLLCSLQLYTVPGLLWHQ